MLGSKGNPQASNDRQHLFFSSIALFVVNTLHRIYNVIMMQCMEQKNGVHKFQYEAGR